MEYDVKLIKKQEFKPTFWSGGMATELTTFPPNSNYSSRNFLWRLGVAKIDISESTFSDLPGVFRKFMVTEGNITLDHENQYRKLLNTFEQDSFMGDWKTKTYGKATVFNLMTRENYTGELIHFNVPPKDQSEFKYNIPLDKNLVSICFYLITGSYELTLNDTTYIAEKDDLMLINFIDANPLHNFRFTNHSLESNNIVISIIYN